MNGQTARWLRALSWDRRLTLTERAAALTVGSLADGTGQATCGSARLARILGTNRRVSSRLLRVLEAEHGLIVSQGRNAEGEALYGLCQPERREL